MREIGAFEAKNRLGALLDAVERGEEITITRRGKPVARLVRPATVFDRTAAKTAAARIRKRRKGVTLGGLGIKDSHQRRPAVSLVLDASLALAWYFHDEATPVTDAILDRVAETGAVVPALWRLELANGLQTAVRRGRNQRGVS